MVVIQDTVQRLDPLRIDVSIQDYPVVATIFYQLSRTGCQYAFVELSGVVIHVAEQLCPRYGLWVDQVDLEWDVHFLIRFFENLPNGGLTTSRWAD